MNLRQKVRECALFLVLAFLICFCSILHPRSVMAQSNNNTTDDGSFVVFTEIEYDGDSISAFTSDPTPDVFLNYAVYNTEGEPTWTLIGDNYSDGGSGYSFTSGSVPTGSTYTAAFYFSVVYYYYGYTSPENPTDCGGIIYGDGDYCEAYDEPSGNASIYVPGPPPAISSVSPGSAYQGQQGTLTISGSNFATYNAEPLILHLSSGGTTFTQTTSASACTSCTANFSFDFTGYSPGTYNLWISNDEAASEPVSFMIYAGNGNGGALAPIADPCAVGGSEPRLGFTSIAATGTGGNGTLAVSFSGGAFATVNPSVSYGPYSTPESIAASIAATVTRNYFRYGLTAKAFGANVIYSGNSALGAVTNSTTGASFTTSSSPTSASAVEGACQSAPADTNSYTLAPARLNLSTGDTLKRITITPSLNVTMSGIAYTSSLINNHASSCQANLTFASPASSSTAVTAASQGCSGVFGVTAAVNATTTNTIQVVVPPQQLIQVLWGEANVAVSGSGQRTAQTLMEALGNTIGNRYLASGFSPNTSWQAIISAPQQFDGYGAGQSQVQGVEPELDAAANVFSQSLPIVGVGGAQCFFSPDPDGWTAIQQAQTSNASSVPVVNYAPTCYQASTKQYIIKTSTGTRSSGRPWFIFVQQKQPSDPAVVTIP